MAKKHLKLPLNSLSRQFLRNTPDSKLHVLEAYVPLITFLDGIQSVTTYIEYVFERSASIKFPILSTGQIDDISWPSRPF